MQLQDCNTLDQLTHPVALWVADLFFQTLKIIEDVSIQ